MYMYMCTIYMYMYASAHDHGIAEKLQSDWIQFIHTARTTQCIALYHADSLRLGIRVQLCETNSESSFFTKLVKITI